MESSMGFQWTYKINKQMLGGGKGVKREIVLWLKFSNEDYHDRGKR